MLPEAERVLDTARGVSEAMHQRMFADITEESGRRGIAQLQRLKDRISAMEDADLSGDQDTL